MPKIRPGFVTQVPTTTYGAGSSDTQGSKLAFTTSPLFDGSYLDSEARKRFFAPTELIGRDLNDGGYAYGSINRYYDGTPNLAEVVVGGGGKPGSPFGPNIASPGAGNGVNPAAIPDSGVEATERVRSKSAGAFVGSGLMSPHQTRAAIAERTSLELGIGSGNSFRIRIT